MAESLYYKDAYLRTFETVVDGVEDGAVSLRESAFYPGGGGQPADRGIIEFNGKTVWVVQVERRGPTILHKLDGGCPEPGGHVRCLLDWDLRYRYMRLHTALHILSAVVFRDWGADVTGSNIAEGGAKARMDFSLEGVRINEILDEVELKVNAEVEKQLRVKTYELPKEEAMRIPGLIRTHVNLLPADIDRVRIVEIEALDIQADGGTHVSNACEVGRVKILGGSNKGKINRRIEITLDDPEVPTRADVPPASAVAPTDV